MSSAESHKPTGTLARPVINGQVYPRIGLALGSGAAKAICQFGILKRLQEENIPVSYIMGSSMGAILGGVYALGLDVELAIDKAYHFAEVSNINNISNFNLLHESVYKKDYIDNLLREIFSDFTFEDCKIPFTVTSVDLESGKVVLLNKGQLVPAIRASTSIPGIFSPVLMNEHYLVDGGLLEDCPVSPLRQQGDCDILIGAYIQDEKNRQYISAYIYNKCYKKEEHHNFLTAELKRVKNDITLLGAIMLRSLDILRREVWSYKLKEAHPDIMMNINIEKVDIFDYKKTSDLIKVGEKVFDKHYPTLKKLIEEKKKELNARG